MNSEHGQEDDDGIGHAARRPAAAAAPAGTGEHVDAAARVSDTGLDGALNDNLGVGGIRDKHTFTLDFPDRRGHRWTGRFVTAVLTVDERTRVGILRSRILGGLPPDAVDRATLNIAEMRAHLALALKEAPKWASDLKSIRDTGVLAAVYEEVAAHERRFWGTDREGAGEGDGA